MLFNFKYFNFFTAIKFPVILSNNVRFQKMGGTVKIPDKYSFGSIKIGFAENRGFDNKNAKVIWHNEGSIVFKGKCTIGNGVRLAISKNALLEIGNAVTFSGNSQIICGSITKIGLGCLIGWDVMLLDYDAHSIIVEGKRTNTNKGITLGSNVWIGARSSILKGVQIEDGIVIAACSNVTRSLGIKNSIYAGNPAKIVKENISWQA